MDNHSLRAEYLLKWGARVDSRNVNNYTALHLACKFNNFDCVKELMAHNSSTGEQRHVYKLHLTAMYRRIVAIYS